MRIDDAIDTVLEHAGARDPLVRAAVCEQLADLLAQGRGGDRTEEALSTMERLRVDLPEVAAPQSAESQPEQASPGIAQERPALIPLETQPHPAVADGERQIRHLLDRIAEFRAEVTAPDRLGLAIGDEPSADDRLAAAAADLADGRWEADRRGLVMTVDGGLPPSLVGTNLGALHDPSETLRRALARHAPFRDVGVELGDLLRSTWCLSGVPVFDPRDGRLTGFRGTGRAAKLPETPPPRSGLFGTGVPSDSLSQMAHEVRSPLNAIMGFAQMIEGQFLGPASDDYRAKAGAIIGNAERLLMALDDLTDAARLEQGRFPTGVALFDVARLVTQSAERYRALAAERDVMLACSDANGVQSIWGDEHSTQRALHRLLNVAIAAAGTGETLTVAIQVSRGDQVRICVTRPARLVDVAVETLFDPTGLTGDHPSLIGLGFGLRLVRQIATVLGGDFTIEPRHFALTLPSIAQGRSAAVS